MKNLLYSLLVFLAFWSCKTEEENIPQINEDEQEVSLLKDASYALESPEDLDILLNEMEGSRYVLLGEASHGTSEYYTWRAEISKRLIMEENFNLIAVEGDWPDLYKLNQYIKGSSEHGASAVEVLQQMDRWPTWMWANEEVAEFAEWLREYNQGLPEAEQVGFYGLDVYSLWDSMREVVAFLEGTDPESAQLAREAYACLAPYEPDEWAYAQAKGQNVNCADELAAALELVQEQVDASPEGDEAAFNALQNALIAVNAERYYSTAINNSSASWNIRDRHMMETINNLMEHHGENSKIVVWEHNTHVGDARATSMAGAGMVNVGQLVREEHEGEGVYIVGFGSYSGSVIAASKWGAQMQEMEVPAAREGSWEALLHSSDPVDKIILLQELREEETYMQMLGHRAIGVQYNPGAEMGNYVPSVLPDRYDAFIYIEESQALTPLSPRAPGTSNIQTEIENIEISDLQRNY